MRSTFERLRHQRRFSASLNAFAEIPLLRTGLHQGLFEALRTPQSAAQLAERTGLAADLVEAWARAAHALGWLRRRGEEYAIVPAVGWLLDAPEAFALHALIDHAVESYLPRLAELPELMKGAERPPFGAPAEAVRTATVSRLVEKPALRALARVPGVDHARRILDVGCGQGAYLAALLTRRRDAQGIGVELDPSVADEARHRLREEELSRRAEIRVGDFMTLELPKGSFDLVLLNHNLHYFPAAEHGALFRRARGRLAEGGVLALQSWVRTEDPRARLLGLAPSTALFDLILRLHRNLHGLPDPEALHRALREAGFESSGEVAVLPGGAVRYFWARKGPLGGAV